MKSFVQFIVTVVALTVYVFAFVLGVASGVDRTVKQQKQDTKQQIVAPDRLFPLSEAEYKAAQEAVRKLRARHTGDLP